MPDRPRPTELDAAQHHRERHRRQRDQHQDEEAVHVAEERRLRLHLLSNPIDRPLLRLDERAALGGEIGRRLVQRVLILHVRRTQRFDQPALMELLAMRQYVGKDRNADRAAGVARRVDQRRGLTGLLGRNAVVRRGRDRDEDQRDPERLQHSGLRDEPEADIAIDVGQPVHRQRDDEGPGDDQVFRLDLARQAAGEEHRDHGDDAAGRQCEAGPRGRIAELLLRQLRKRLRGRQQDRAGRQHHDKAGAELARRHHAQVDHGIAAGDLPGNHEHEGERAHDRRPDDESRAEPVVLEPAVEHELEGAEEGCDQHEADEVEPDAALRRRPALRGRLLAQQDGNRRHRGEADRAVDQEAPMPGHVVGKPPAKRRPDHRRDHHGDAEQRKRLAALFRRKCIREDRLRHRYHAAAAEALQDAKEQQRLQIPGEAAQHRGGREHPEADEEEALAAHHPGEERARRQDDRIRDQVGRHHPRSLVLAHPHAARDVGQRHVGDGGIEHFHEGCERDHRGDQPGVDGRVGARAACRRAAASRARDGAHSHAVSRS